MQAQAARFKTLRHSSQSKTRQQQIQWTRLQPLQQLPDISFHLSLSALTAVAMLIAGADNLHGRTENNRKTPLREA